MKIWLNHTLACPNDASYPLKLSIFQWESQKEKFRKLLDGFCSKKLYNFRNEESPLEIYTLESSHENDIVQKNIEQLTEETGIIHLVEIDDKIYLFDANIIDPVSLHVYARMYLDMLEEFALIFDRSTKKLENDVFHVVTHTLYSEMRTFLGESTKILNDRKQIEDFLRPRMQDLLYLNIFLTYFEIEEGLLVCSNCKRWYPIIKTIPRIYPKTMKREEMDHEFLKKWREYYPDDVILD
jgi:uncharacterized protein YbaR (Trm112 family)